MTSPAALSVIIVAKNEAHDIADCLRSVRGLATEVLVFDSGSTDGTPEICRGLGAKVFETDWPGFGAQKNRAIDAASGEWILSLDADERVGDGLRVEILALLSGNPASRVYRMPRSSSFCGRFMRHSGWWPDHVTRLFRRGAARFEGTIHEKLVHEGDVGTLNSPIIHLAIPALEESLEKVNAYSTAGAKALAARGKRSSIAHAALRGLWMFFRCYFLKLGVLDGREGFVLAVLNAEGTFHKYAKLAFVRSGGK